MSSNETKLVNFFKLCHGFRLYPCKSPAHNYSFQKIPNWSGDVNKYADEIRKTPKYTSDEQVRKAATEAYQLFNELMKEGMFIFPWQSTLPNEIYFLTSYSENSKI